MCKHINFGLKKTEYYLLSLILLCLGYICVIAPLQWTAKEKRLEKAAEISLMDLSRDSSRITPPLLPENDLGSKAAIVSSIAEIKEKRVAVGCLLTPTLTGDVIVPVLFIIRDTSDNIKSIWTDGRGLNEMTESRLAIKCDSFNSADFR
jgi:hypothetical protein